MMTSSALSAIDCFDCFLRKTRGWPGDFLARLLDFVLLGVVGAPDSLSQSLSVAAALLYVESASSSSLVTFRFLAVGVSTSSVSAEDACDLGAGIGVGGSEAAIGDMAGANDAAPGDWAPVLRASLSFSLVLANLCSRFDSFLRNFSCLWRSFLLGVERRRGCPVRERSDEVLVRVSSEAVEGPALR